jgi:hypothetical protein
MYASLGLEEEDVRALEAKLQWQLNKELGCAFLQKSPEFPGILRNLGSKKKELRTFFAGMSRKGRTDC